jgi:hypothetical protein
MIPIDCYNSKNLKREFMKKFNILITTSALALLATGCVKPAQDTQTIYNGTTTQPVVYEEAQPIVYEPAATGTIYEEVQPVITTGGYGEVVTANTGTTYPDPYANGGGTVYNDSYSSQPAINDYPASSSAPVGQGGGIHLQIAALKE